MQPFAFDLDGTLISCRERQVGVMHAALLDLGVEHFNKEQFWVYKRGGKTTYQSLEMLGLSDEVALQATSAWLDQIEKNTWLAFDSVFPCSKHALRRVFMAGFQPVVITARRRDDAARHELSELGLTDLIGELVVVPPKDAWSHKADALSRMDAVGFVGDTESDARAASVAKVPFAAVSAGQRDEAFLRGHGVTRIYATVDEAADALLTTMGQRHNAGS